MPKLKKIIFIMGFSIGTVVCRAETPPATPSSSVAPPSPTTAPERAAQAEKLFMASDWNGAVQAYRSILLEVENASLAPAFFYNFGTSLGKAGQSGEAYIVLLRAAASSPLDSDMQHNLNLIKKQAPASALSVKPALWLSWWPESLQIWTWKLWLACSLVVSGLALVLIGRLEPLFPQTLAILATVLFLCTAMVWLQARLPVYGVSSLAKVKSGPGQTFSDLSSLEPGALVNGDLERDGWIQVRFVRQGMPGESVGWIDSKALLRVL